MGRAKIPRKSTNIDMTAMCDVAFLLLSFFILATKTKPPEAVSVVTPTSIQKRPVPKNEVLLISIGNDNRVFLTLPESRKGTMMKYLNQYYPEASFNIADTNGLGAVPFIGVPLKGLAALSADKGMSPSKMPGIPVSTDSTKNELIAWIRAFKLAHYDVGVVTLQQRIAIKGDGSVKYPIIQAVKTALKSQDFNKFNIVTNPEGIERGTEVANNMGSLESEKDYNEASK